MPISKRMLTHKATVNRQVAGAGMVTKAAVYKTNVAGSLQPLTNKTALEYSLVPGKAYAFYTNDYDFKKTDTLLVDGVTYVVRESTPYTGFGNVSHNMVLLEKAA